MRQSPERPGRERKYRSGYVRRLLRAVKCAHVEGRAGKTWAEAKAAAARMKRTAFRR